MTAQHFFVMYINHAQRRTKNNLQKAVTDMPDKTSLVRSYFDAIANRYDLMNTLLSGGLHHAWKNRAIKEASVNGDMHVLDVCGGTGDLAAIAATFSVEEPVYARFDESESEFIIEEAEKEADPTETVETPAAEDAADETSRNGSPKSE